MSDVLSFDISKNPKGNPITYGRVGDTNGLTRKVKIFDDGKPLDLTGYVITFEGNTSKYKTKVFDTDGISIVDATKGEFNYTFPNMAFAVEGQYERAYFSFASVEKRMTTADFQVIVFGNSDIDAEEAETIITEYNKLVKELHEMQDQYIEETDQRFLVLNQQLDALHSQVDDLVARLDAGDFYTKTESDDKYSTKNSVYTKNESDLTFATKTETDILYAKKNDFDNHTKDKENPHEVTKSQVGLGDVANFSVATEEEAKAGEVDQKYMTPAKTKIAIEELRPIRDTGWINLEYKPGYNFESRFMPKYRKIGNRVFFQGQLAGGAANGVFAVMPEEFRPSYIAHTDVAAVSGNATEKGRVYVDSTSGEVSLVAQSGSKGYWLDELTYLID